MYIFPWNEYAVSCHVWTWPAKSWSYKIKIKSLNLLLLSLFLIISANILNRKHQNIMHNYHLLFSYIFIYFFYLLFLSLDFNHTFLYAQYITFFKTNRRSSISWTIIRIGRRKYIKQNWKKSFPTCLASVWPRRTVKRLAILCHPFWYKCNLRTVTRLCLSVTLSDSMCALPAQRSRSSISLARRKLNWIENKKKISSSFPYTY